MAPTLILEIQTLPKAFLLYWHIKKKN